VTEERAGTAAVTAGVSSYSWRSGSDVIAVTIVGCCDLRIPRAGRSWPAALSLGTICDSTEK
jgi:hypothetical protein